MQVGTDSYVTLAEANTYIASHYTSKSIYRKCWDNTLNEDKEILLVEACSQMELLKFQGRKAVAGQPLSFPRLPMQYGRTDEGAPGTVKAAQIELALWLSDESKQAEYLQRRELQEQGVTSFTVEGLSENYSKPTDTVHVPPKVKTLLASYLNGGYQTC